MAILTVTGSGSAAKPADRIHIRLNLVAQDRDYASTMERSSAQLKEVQKALHKLGYDKKELITEHYNISTQYRSVQIEDRYEQEFVGYRADQNLVLKLAKDDKKLNKLLSALSGLEARPELSLSFNAESRDDLEPLAMERAVQDATVKADVLCKASAQRLGNILAIRYPAGAGGAFPVQEKRMMMSGAASMDMSMEAADITHTVQVEIQFETLDKS